MNTDYRRLLELSARAEEKWLVSHDDRYYTMARRYLDAAIEAPKGIA